MKIKTLLFCAAVVGMSFMSSCKKDWDCQCNTNGAITNHTINNETLLNARSKCKSYESSVAGITTSCSLN